MATKLYKKNADGEISTESVKAEYVYACMQDGWVCSLAELAHKKEHKKESKKLLDKKENNDDDESEADQERL